MAGQPVPPTRAAGERTAAVLGNAVVAAQGHTAVGDLPAAVAVLHGPLSHLDPTVASTAHAVDAAALFAHALAGTGHPGPALQWATWAYRTSQALYHRGDPRALRPAQVHAAMLAATGNTGHAVAAYRDLVDMLTRLDGPTGPRTLHARADLAVALHRHGTCPAAHATLDDAWVLCRTRYGRTAATAVRMGARLAMMYRDCGDPHQAAQRFAQARHDAAGTPLDRPVTAAADRPPDPAHHHVCTHTPGTTRIHWPPTEHVTPSAPTPGRHHARQPHPPQHRPHRTEP